MKVILINEVIDADGGLIGSDNVPKTGPNMSTVSKKITDYNMAVGHQPFGDSMMGYFGSVMLPFFEGEGSDEKNKDLTDTLEILRKFYEELMKHYYKNPNSLKNDFRIYTEKETISKDVVKYFEVYAKEIVKKFGDKPSSVDESIVDEDTIVDKKIDNFLSAKSNDRDITDKSVTKIAGLINKLDNGSKNKLKNLIEVSK
jgi:hypothetical protein